MLSSVILLTAQGVQAQFVDGLDGASNSSIFETGSVTALPTEGWSNVSGAARIFDSVVINGSMIGTTAYGNYGAEFNTGVAIQPGVQYTLTFGAGFVAGIAGGTAQYQAEIGILSGGVFTPLAQVTGNVFYYGNIAVIPAQDADSFSYLADSNDSGVLVVRLAQTGTTGPFLSDFFGFDNVRLEFILIPIANLFSNSLNGVTFTSNQIAVSNVLTTLAASNPTAILDILNNVLLLTTAGVQQAFDSLSGVQHTHGQVLTHRLSQQFLNFLLHRGSQSQGTPFAFNSLQNFDPMSEPLLAYNGSNWPMMAASASAGAYGQGLDATERGWWLQGFGGFGDIDTTTNVSGADYDTVGFAFGVDSEWRDMVIGIAGSYASSDVDTFGGDLDIDSYQIAGYGNWQLDGQSDAIYINAAIGFGYHDTDSSRVVNVGTASSTATSDYDSYNISAAVVAGKDFALSSATTLTPFVGVEYSHFSRDDFTETGAGTANLSADDEDQDSLRSKLGLRLSHDITTQQDKRITPYVDVAYVREFMDNISRMDAGFATVPKTTFRVDGTDLDRDRLQVGLGITGQINERTTLNVGYNGELADSDDNHSFAATLRFTW